jgi:hypothetical protein
LKIFTVFNILFKTEDGPFLEINRLAHNLAQNVGVVKNLSWGLNTWGASWGTKSQNGWSFENFSFDLVWLKIDRELPFFHFFGASNHVINLRDALDTVLGLLEKALTDISHNLLVFANFRRNTN